MGNFQDTVQVRVVVDGEQAINNLSKLEAEAAQLAQEMKKLGANSEEYAQKSEQLRRVTAILKTQEEQAKKLKQEYKDLQASGADANLIAAKKAEWQALKANIRESKEEAKSLRLELSKMGKNSDEYKSLKAQHDSLTEKIIKQRQEIGITAMSYKQLGQYLRNLQKDWEVAIPDTAKHKELGAEILKVKQRMSELRPAISETKSAWQKFNDEIHMMRNLAFGNIFGELAVRGFDFLLEKITGVLDVSAKLSDQLSDIDKKANFSKDANVSMKMTKQLNSELSSVDTRTSTSDLRDTAQIGAALGYGNSVEELKAFTIEMDKINVALGDEFTGGVKESSMAIGTLKQIFKETKEMEVGTAFRSIGSAINALGNIGSATAPQMADFANRVGALGNLSPSISDVLGLGAGLQELGLSSERASGGVTSILIEAGKTKNLGAFAAQIGMTKKAFQEMFDSSPNKMLLELAKSFQGLSNSEIIAGLERLGVSSQEAVTVMELLQNQTDFILHKQKVSNEEFKKASSINEEFDKKNKNFAAEVEKAKKEITAFEGALSSALLPTMTALMRGFLSFLAVLKATPQFLREISPLIYGLMVALIALNAQKIKNIGLEIASKTATLAKTIADKAATIQAAQNTAATAANNVATERLTFSKFKSIVADKAATFWTNAKTVATNVSTIAQWALNTAMTANPIGLVVAALALLAGAMVIAYEKSETFRSVVAGLNNIFISFWDYLKGVINGIANLDFASIDQTFTKIFGVLYESIKDFVKDAKAIFEKIFDLDKLSILYEKIKIFVQDAKALWDAIFSFDSKKITIAFAKLMSSFQTFNASFKNYLNGITAVFDEIGKKIIGFFSKIFFYVSDFGKDVKALFAAIFTFDGEKIEAAFQKIVSKLKNLLNNFWNYIKGVINGIMNLDYAAIDQNLTKIFGFFYTNIKNLVKDVKGLWDAIFDFDSERIVSGLKKVVLSALRMMGGIAIKIGETIYEGYVGNQNKEKAKKEAEEKAKRAKFLEEGMKSADESKERLTKKDTKELSEEDKKRIAENKRRAALLGQQKDKKENGDDALDKELKKLEEFTQKVQNLREDLHKKQLSAQEREVFETQKKYQDLTEEIKKQLSEVEKNEKLSQTQKLKFRQDYWEQVKKLEVLEEQALEALRKNHAEENFLKRLEDQKRQAQELAELGSQGLAQLSKKNEAKANIDNFFASDLDKALAENDKKYKALIDQAHEFGLDTKSLLELQGFEIQAISAKFAQDELADNYKNSSKKLEWKRKELEALKNFELQKAEVDYNNEKSKLIDQGFTETDIVELKLLDSKESMLAKIRAKYRQIELDETKKLVERKSQLREEDFKAASTVAQSFEDLTVNMFDVLGANIESQSGLMKSFRLFQIGLDTAAAISSLTAASEANPANPVSFGAAGVTQFIAGLARIFANIGQAKKLLDAPKPKAKAAKGGIFDGASHDEGGMTVIDNKTKEPKVEVEGGEPFLVLSKNTYGNNKSLIDTLLYNSMYRNGAAVMPNVALMSKAQNFRMAQGGLVGTLPKLDETPKNTDELALLMQIANGINTLVSLYSQKATQQQTVGKYEILKVLKNGLDDFSEWENSGKM